MTGREKAAKDDWNGLLIALQGHLGATRNLGDRIADAHVGELLDIRDDVTDLADAEFVAGDLARPKPPQADDLVLLLAGHQTDLLADLERAVDNPDVDDHALVVVELGVENRAHAMAPPDRRMEPVRVR